MIKITSRQIQNLYAIASKLNILENGNKDDDFHNLVYSLTNKKSVSSLNGADYYKVRDKLMSMQDKTQYKKTKKIKKEKTRDVAGMTQGQTKKVWFLMYELEKATPMHATVGARLKGIIKRQLKMDVDIKNPFEWLTYKQGNQLIEILKKYVYNAHLKKSV